MTQNTIAQVLFMVVFITVLRVISLRSDVRLMKLAYIGMLGLTTVLGVLLVLSASTASKAIGAGFIAGYIVQPAYAFKRSFVSVEQEERYRDLNKFARRVSWLHLIAGVTVLLLAAVNITSISGFEKNWTDVLLLGGIFSVLTLIKTRWQRRRLMSMEY